MNKSNSPFSPLIILGLFFLLLWLYMTEQISGILFCILSAALFVFAFTKNTSVLALAAVCACFAGLAWRVEKVVMAVQTTANFNSKTAEALECASQRLLASSKEQTRNLKLKIALAIFTFGAALLQMIHHFVGH